MHKVLHQTGCRNLDWIQFSYDGSDLFAKGRLSRKKSAPI